MSIKVQLVCLLENLSAEIRAYCIADNYVTFIYQTSASN